MFQSTPSGYKHSFPCQLRATQMRVHRRMSQHAGVLACVLGVLAQGAQARRCADFALDTGVFPAWTAADTCRTFLEDNGAGHLYADAHVDLQTRCSLLHTQQACACPAGTRLEPEHYLATTQTHGALGVFGSFAPHAGAVLRCTATCPAAFSAVLESDDVRACACWGRGGCMFSERVYASQVHNVRQAVMLVPDDLMAPVDVVSCTHEGQERVGAAILCAVHGVASRLPPASGGVTEAACTPGFYRAGDDCRPCTKCAAYERESRACAPHRDRECAAIDAAPAAPVPAHAQDTHCRAGHAFNHVYQECMRCSGGTYATSHLTACLLCPVNTESARRTVADNCTACPAGFLREASSEHACQPCPTGYQLGAAGVCVACPAGTANPGGLPECVRCAPQTWSAPGSQRCAPCASPSQVVSDAQDRCVDCAPQDHSVNHRCTPCLVSPWLVCDAGHFRDDCTFKNATGGCACGCAKCPEDPPHGHPCPHRCPFGQTLLPSTGACGFHVARLSAQNRVFEIPDFDNPNQATARVPCMDFLTRRIDKERIRDVYHLAPGTSNESHALGALAIVEELDLSIQDLFTQHFPEACHFYCWSGHAFAMLGHRYMCLPCRDARCPSAARSCAVHLDGTDFEALDVHTATHLPVVP